MRVCVCVCVCSQMTERHTEDHCKELQTISTSLTTNQQLTEQDIEVSICEPL